MSDLEFLDLLMRYQDGAISPDDLAQLEHEMSSNIARRRLFTETALQSTTLMERFRHESRQGQGTENSRISSTRKQGRRLVAGALVTGIILGLAGGGFVWAMSSPRVVATSKAVAGLIDGGFEAMNGPLPSGFPHKEGIWSGDGAAIVADGALEGTRRLRFLQAEADANAPNGRAIACDVFQLVSLQGMPSLRGSQGESMLELSASFVDERPENTNPSVTFFCQLYLFHGDSSTIQKSWPINIGDAVASGSSETTTLGAGQWRRVTVKSLVPASADYAVIHIAARPNLRGSMPMGLFVDDVRLRLKTQPAIPVKVVEQ